MSTGKDKPATEVPLMLQYMGYLDLNANLKISSVLSVAKISGAFVALDAKRKPRCSTAPLVEKIDYGSSLSVSISLQFKNANDRARFQKDFKNDAPFSMSDSPGGNSTDSASNNAAAARSDTEMSKRLATNQASSEMVIAQVGGDVADTRQFVSKITCSIDKLESCRKARRDIIRHFYTEELKKPDSPDQTNGWVEADVSSLPLTHN